MTDDTGGAEKEMHILGGIKGIVFDLDDTLYLQKDYKISGFHAVAHWLEDNRYSTWQDSIASLHTILDLYGPSYPYMFNRLLEGLSLPEVLVSQLVHIFTHHQPTITLFPEVREMLIHLRSQFKLGILTDGQLRVQQSKVNALGLESIVDTILYSDTLGLSKPAQQLFAWFEAEFKLSGQEMAYVADNPIKDFFGANQRGWQTIRVLTGEFTNTIAAEKYEATSILAQASLLTCP
jgi:putative hydrolase of the HAD superfamily